MFRAKFKISLCWMLVRLWNYCCSCYQFLISGSNWLKINILWLCFLAILLIVYLLYNNLVFSPFFKKEQASLRFLDIWIQGVQLIIWFRVYSDVWLYTIFVKKKNFLLIFYFIIEIYNITNSNILCIKYDLIFVWQNDYITIIIL